MKWLSLALVLTACGAAPIKPNDPELSETLFCTSAAADPAKSACYVDQPTCEADVERNQAAGVASTPCVPSYEAYCFLVPPDYGDRWTCAPTFAECQADRKSVKGTPMEGWGECEERELKGH